MDGPGSEGIVEVVRLRHRGHWFGLAILLVFAAWLIYQLVTNPGFQWPVVGGYLGSTTILAGVGLTLELTVLAMIIGIVLGVVLAVMRLAQNPLLSAASSAYIWFFRGTPVLVQLIFWFNLAVLFPTITLGVPFGGPKFFGISSNSAISAFTAALLGLGLNEAAYMAEIIRGGLISVDAGQTDAAQAVGMTSLQTLRHVILPQAMRAIIPPTGNQTIGMLKYTSLASVISLQELLNSAETIYARTFQTIPLLIVASLWYLVLTSILSVGQYYVEKYYARGSNRTTPPNLLSRLIPGVGGGARR